MTTFRYTSRTEYFKNDETYDQSIRLLGRCTSNICAVDNAESASLLSVIEAMAIEEHEIMGLLLKTSKSDLVRIRTIADCVLCMQNTLIPIV